MDKLTLCLIVQEPKLQVMKNSEKSKHPDKQTPENNVDSPINLRGTERENKELNSLTNDEDSATDPNEVKDKAAFGDNNENEENNTGRFDGTIGI